MNVGVRFAICECFLGASCVGEYGRRRGSLTCRKDTFAADNGALFFLLLKKDSLRDTPSVSARSLVVQAAPAVCKGNHESSRPTDPSISERQQLGGP